MRGFDLLAGDGYGARTHNQLRCRALLEIVYMPSVRLIVFGIIAGLSLSACVTDPAAFGDLDAAKGTTAPLVGADVAYGALTDAGLNLPAVPVAEVPPEFQRQTVDFASDQVPGTIIINPGARQLYFVTGKNKAIRYGIAVGRAGFQWSGEAIVNERKTWPTWTPPEEMIERKPELAQWEEGMPGGLENPLGARALYLTTNGVDYGYRIHGTPEWFSIGKNASSGCIRMINQDVIDLYSRVPDGAKVVVLNADGSMPTGLTLPPPQPKKEKPKPVEEPVVPAPAVSGVSPIIGLPVPGLGGAVGPVAVAPVVTTPPTPAPALTPIPAATAPESCLVKNPDGTCLCSVLLVNGLCPVL